MLTCRELTEQATDYFEGHLSFGRRLSIRVHALMCAHCRRFLEQLRMLTVVLRGLAHAEAAPDAVQQRLVRAYRERGGR